MTALRSNRLMKFGCTCGEVYRVMVRTSGDTFRCRSCKVRFVFPDRTAETKAFGSGSDVGSDVGSGLGALAKRCQQNPEATYESVVLFDEDGDDDVIVDLRVQLETERERVRELERRQKMMERQWVEQTLALYMEFETSLRPRVHRAEASEATLKERVQLAEKALLHAKEEMDAAWNLADERERGGRKSLELLERTSNALQGQFKLLKQLKPVLEVCLREPDLLRAKGVDTLFCRAALIKCLEMVDRSE